MKTINTVRLIFIICFSILITVIPLKAEVLSQRLQDYLQSSNPSDEVRVIVKFKDETDLNSFSDKCKIFSRYKLIKALKHKLNVQQKYYGSFLDNYDLKDKRELWVINSIAFTANVNVLFLLANEPNILSIDLDEIINLIEILPADSSIPEWNLNISRIPELWALGVTGTDIVAANMDTGVDFNHPDLADKWRGGTNSWLDVYGQHSLPYDADGHGTQTMGIILGGNSSGTAIGVAPGAKWIAVKIYDDFGNSSLSNIHYGFQWLLDPDGNPLTNDSPDIVNNSWAFSSNVNEYVPEFRTDIRALKLAGIAVICSAGNSGPNSNTSVSPANYPESFAVGAIDDSSNIAYFSSRGHSAYDGTIYPEITAPGINIKTSDLTFGGVFPNSYAYVSGTSFSSAHVAGVMALLLSAYPDLSISQLESVIKQSAIDLGSNGPDNNYGYGLIDAMGAYNLILESMNNEWLYTTWYLAEGCTNGFDTWILIENPNNTPAACRVTFMEDSSGYGLQSVEPLITVNANSRYSIHVNTDYPEMNNKSFAAKIESTNGIGIIVERAMYWNSGGMSMAGGHDSIGTPIPETTWYFAEGCTNGFDEYILIQNPNAIDASVSVVFMRSNGLTVTRNISVPATSRQTIHVNDFVPNDSVSTQVTSNIPVISERSMYWDAGGVHWKGGHNSVGVTAPAITWYLAEGCTNGFDEWVLIQNPNAVPANVTATFMKSNGQTVPVNISVPATSRYTIHVNDIVPNDSVSTKVESTNGVGIIVERAMYWGAGGVHWSGGHSSPGITNPGTAWYLAEGSTQGTFDEWVLIQNPNATAANAAVNFMKSNGQIVPINISIPATSRYTIHVNDIVPNEAVSTQITSDLPVVAERAMYWDSGGVHWIEGHCSTGIGG